MSQQTGARGQLETLLVRRTPLRVYNPRTRPYTHREAYNGLSIQPRSRYASIMRDLLSAAINLSRVSSSPRINYARTIG